MVTCGGQGADRPCLLNPTSSPARCHFWAVSAQPEDLPLPGPSPTGRGPCSLVGEPAALPTASELPAPRPGPGLRAQVRDRPERLLALGLRLRARLCRPTAGRSWRTRAAELVQNCLPCCQRGSSRRAVNHSVTDL